MKMRNLILAIASSMVFLASCSSEGNKADTGDAKSVENKTTEGSVVYKTQDAASHLKWRASHLGGLQKRFGKVMLKSAEVSVTDGKVTNASVLIEMNSLTVENFEDAASNTKLTGHLKNADFFDVEKFSTSKFELTQIEPGTGDFNSKVTGNLTIKSVTKSITFNANITVSDSQISVKSEDFSVDRTNWGLSYNVEGTEGVPADYLIANEVGFTIDVVVKK